MNKINVGIVGLGQRGSMLISAIILCLKSFSDVY